MRRADYSRIAEADIRAIAEYIRMDRPRSAVRFLSAVDKTVERLLGAPESGAYFETNNAELADMRATLVKGFKKYLLFYRVHADSILIERVLHGARNLDELL